VALWVDGLTALVADQVNSRISVWTRTAATATDWKNQTTFGSQGDGPTQFSNPTGVALSGDGRTAVVADRVNNRISVWTRTTATATDWKNQTTFGSQGSDPDQFTAPLRVSLSTDGLAVSVVDSFNNRISVWTRSTATGIDWKNQSTFGSEGAGPAQFNYPEGVALSVDGLTAAVADAGNNRMSIWTRVCTG
jgi:DNA-binding beta-propeller fold protein YncE